MLEDVEFTELYLSETKFSYRKAGSVFSMDENQRRQAMGLYQKVISINAEQGKNEFSLTRDGNRYRVFVIDSVTGIKIIMRKMPVTVQLWESLGFPEHYLEKLLYSPIPDNNAIQSGGLIFICGRLSSSVTASAYALINEILLMMPWACTTIESPVETFLPDEYPSGACVIQREVMSSQLLPTLISTLKSNQDMIMVSELNDHEGAKLILDAARAGILVIVTCYAHDIVTAMDCFTAVSGNTELSRKALSEAFRACIWQESECNQSSYRVLSSETLFVDESVKVRLRRGEVSQLKMNISWQKVAALDID